MVVSPTELPEDGWKCRRGLEALPKKRKANLCELEGCGCGVHPGFTWVPAAPSIPQALANPKAWVISLEDTTGKKAKQTQVQRW